MIFHWFFFRLRKGWSYKTEGEEEAYTEQKKTSENKLDDIEQQMILNVIRRAEAIDANEQDRVG